jgi:hypothetical protein
MAICPDCNSETELIRYGEYRCETCRKPLMWDDPQEKLTSGSQCACGHWKGSHNHDWTLPNKPMQPLECKFKKCTCKVFAMDNLEWLERNRPIRRTRS